MIHLYVIRHGETEWNKEKRSQGRLDSSLTEKGKKDARSLGDRLDNTEFCQIISSPSGRTLETARLVKGERMIPLTTDERLMEIDLGAWQGKTEEEVKSLYPEEFDAYWNEPERYKGVGGETFLQVQQRIIKFLKDLEETVTEGNILIVTHGVVMKTLYLLCRNTSLKHLWDPPFIHGTSLTIVSLDAGKKELLLEACVLHIEL
ncbi:MULTISPECIES: histidine phosphatase family protein [Mesobacillus]|uniref:Phosphatase n=2 Tax=Mesobacillus TaxID=2675231 RepID=A0A0D6ZCQ2_9BACI|nr:MULTISPECIES: histidine phosphatase family protein [Mesobacillus]KIY23599.1 phosphatase [Mesobacillus subterraneus]MDQ0413291.1 putative phosphoglycerate mutase [Mesobacillus stamsii]